MLKEQENTTLMDWDGRERRQKRRYGYRDSLLRYKRGGLLSFTRGLSARFLLLNFSEEGCHFMAKEQIPKGTALSLRIEAPKKKAVSATGSVVWCRKSEKHKAYRIGMSFSKLSGSSKIALKNLLDSALLKNVDITTKIYLKEIEKL